MSDKVKKTLVEDGTEFKGSLSSKCPIEVNGHVEGDLSAPSLVISGSGSVHGKVKVGEMRSEGRIAGEFDADLVQLSGTVQDNTVLRAKSLEVKLASQNGKMQVIFGECELEIGAEVAKEASAGDAATKAASVRPPAEEEPGTSGGRRKDKGEKKGSLPPPEAGPNGAV